MQAYGLFTIALLKICSEDKVTFIKAYFHRVHQPNKYFILSSYYLNNNENPYNKQLIRKNKSMGLSSQPTTKATFSPSAVPHP